MNWTVLVPVKPVGTRKERLAGQLPAVTRDELVERMLAHVLGVIEQVPRTRAQIVSGVPLNDALMAGRAMLAGKRMAVIHADLPRIAVDDVVALLEAAERHGVAIAPDRHHQGTNALAIADGRRFAFAFGPDSLARHHAQTPDATIIERTGLGFDVDDIADLALLEGNAEPAPGTRLEHSLARRKA